MNAQPQDESRSRDASRSSRAASSRARWLLVSALTLACSVSDRGRAGPESPAEAGAKPAASAGPSGSAAASAPREEHDGASVGEDAGAEDHAEAGGEAGADAGANAGDEAVADRGAAKPDSALPPWSAFTAVAQEGEWGAPARASKRLWLDETRAVAVVRTRQGAGEGASWRVSLVRLSWDGARWTPSGVRELERWSAHSELDRDGTIAVNLRVEDVDDDGAKELVARYQLDWMCCGAGATARRTLVVVNDDARLSEAAYLQLDEVIYRGGTTGTERFEDRDADGHRDLVVKWTAAYEGEPTQRGETVHAWKAAGDRFHGARRPRGEECYCE